MGAPRAGPRESTLIELIHGRGRADGIVAGVAWQIASVIFADSAGLMKG